MIRQDKIDRFEAVIGYHFSDPALLVQALTHSSYGKEHIEKSVGLKDYERLEFLGDAVLELVTSNYLYQKYDWQEGQLTKTRAKIVCEASLSYIARKNGFGPFLIMGKGEEKTGGRERDSILCDVVESVIGAVYLDSGYDQAEQLIHRLVLDHLDQIPDGRAADYKTTLQEKLQGEGRPIPEYRVVDQEGPTNDRIFTTELYIEGSLVSTARGRSKKQAAQEAARQALEKLWN